MCMSEAQQNSWLLNAISDIKLIIIILFAWKPARAFDQTEAAHTIRFAFIYDYYRVFCALRKMLFYFSFVDRDCS